MLISRHCRDSDVGKQGGLSYLMGINAGKDKKMSVKNLRQKKGWSQEHLAQASGLSLRTIQRIESGKRAGLETLNGLAAVFDIDLNLIKPDTRTGLAHSRLLSAPTLNLGASFTPR